MVTSTSRKYVYNLKTAPGGYRVVKFDCVFDVEAVYNLRFPRTVIQNELDMGDAQRQLQHAKEQLDLTKQYPARDRLGVLVIPQWRLRKFRVVPRSEPFNDTSLRSKI
jgi:hypothetical protein